MSSKKKKKECFLAFFSCLRWENASLSAIHLMQLFPRNFKWLPFDYRAKKLFFFSYIHRCFTPLTIWTSINMFIVRICFGKALFSLMKKKTKQRKQPHRFTRVCRFASNKLWRANHSECSCLFKVSFTIKRKKSCQTNNQQLYSRFFVRKI